MRWHAIALKSTVCIHNARPPIRIPSVPFIQTGPFFSSPQLGTGKQFICRALLKWRRSCLCLSDGLPLSGLDGCIFIHIVSHILRLARPQVGAHGLHLKTFAVADGSAHLWLLFPSLPEGLLCDHSQVTSFLPGFSLL